MMAALSDAYYNLPSTVIYCKRCIMSNQRPASLPEFLHGRERKGAKYMHIDKEGVCDACRVADKKNEIDWKSREEELLKLLEKHRRNDGKFDCIVPGSGGKDSAYQAHILKYKYGMHPITVTWPPIMYTDYGYKNFKNWIEVGGFDNVSYKPNGKVHKLLTKLAIQNLLHPFQTFILGQKNLAPKIAMQMNIPLIFYGESEAEYGNPIAETSSSLRDNSYFTFESIDDIRIAGLTIKELRETHGVSSNDLLAYLPAGFKELEKSNIEVHYLGYYLKWTPQEAFYYAVENTGFQPRPERSQGTFSKYNSIDDKIDDLHYYTTWIKFGLGRASYDASQEIRNKHIVREEGIALAKRYDGEFPDRYFDEIMAFLNLDKDEFFELADSFRSPHLWMSDHGKWKLRQPVWEENHEPG